MKASELEQFLRSLDGIGLFEVSSAFWRARIPPISSQCSPEVITESITNFSFAAGGDISARASHLQSIYRRFKALHKDQQLTADLCHRLLTLSGPLINSGLFTEAHEIMAEAAAYSKRPSLEVAAMLARREVMCRGTLGLARTSAELTAKICPDGWGHRTADTQVFSAATRIDTLTAAIDIQADLLSDDTLTLSRPLESILADASRLLRKHSLFHYTNLLFALGSLELLRRNPNNALAYLYRTQFLSIALGIRLIPAWDPRMDCVQQQRCMITPQELLEYIISCFSVCSEQCREIRSASIGKDALLHAANLTSSFASAALTSARKHEIFRYEI